MAEIKQRVSMLLKGCKCRAGCGSAACGCKKKGERCHEGCDCIGCMNNDHEAVMMHYTFTGRECAGW